MRAEYLRSVIAVALVLAGSVAEAEPRSGDQCLSGVCLGDPISELSDIEWLTPGVSVPDGQPSFPRYEPVVDPATKALADAFAKATRDALLHSPLPRSSVDPVDAMLASAHGLSDPNREALRREATDAGDAIALSAEGIAGLSRLSGVTFCPEVEFVGYFRSKSGHPTLVGFSPVAGPDGADTFIVDAIIRRIPTDTRAMDQLFAELLKEHPSIVHDRDLTTSCGTTGFRLCEEPRLGLAKYPDDWTASQKARFHRRDYFVRFEPRYDDAVISLRLFSANNEPLMKSFRTYGFDPKPIASRIERSRPVVCEPPPAEVPSIE
jgi:hypothetical protein